MSSHQFRSSENDNASKAESAASRESRPPTSTWIRRKAPAEVIDLPNSADSVVSSLPADSVSARLVAALVERGVTQFFGVPGGPICPLFEALRLNDAAALVESRHESHAAFAAVAYYRATRQVAAIVVTAGPGLTNAINGIASAAAEGVPLLVIAGDVAWSTHGGCLAQNSGPEGLNFEQLVAPLTRCQVRITNGRSAIGQALSALDAATSPTRPGPSLVVLPIDRALESVPEMEVPQASLKTTVAPPRASVVQVAAWLAEAKRPLLVLGGGCHGSEAWILRLVDALNVPFVTTPRAKGLVSELHPRSLRNGGMAASHWARSYTCEGVDVALVLGSDLDDSSVGPTPYIGPGGRLVHVDLDPRVFNRNLPTVLGITSDIAHFASDLYDVVTETGLYQTRGRALMRETRALSAFDEPDFEDDDGAQIAPHRAISDLQKAAGDDARFVSDIGEHMLFALHYLTAKSADSFHIQLNLGSMGSGIAGATGLALGDRSRPVVCICGDGGMQMSGMEILTSKKLGLPIVYAVFNDSRYNMVHHGMKQIFGSADAYETPVVDFSAWAHSMGVPARVIHRGGEITPALIEQLLESGGPVLLDIRIDASVRIRGGGRVEALQHMSMLTAHAEAGS